MEIASEIFPTFREWKSVTKYIFSIKFLDFWNGQKWGRSLLVIKSVVKGQNIILWTIGIGRDFYFFAFYVNNIIPNSIHIIWIFLQISFIYDELRGVHILETLKIVFSFF